MPAIREGPMVSQNNSSASEDEDAHAPHVESERHTSSPVPADTARSQQTPPEGAKQPSSSSPKFSQTSPPTRSSRSRSSATPAPKTRPPTCSHGPKTGQELCYLCHQREAKNIAVSFTEERRARELYEDRLLQHYQQQKDSLAIAREQVQSLCELGWPQNFGDLLSRFETLRATSQTARWRNSTSIHQR